MSSSDCESWLGEISDGKIKFEARFLEPASPRQILVRMLRNLKLSYFRRGELTRAINMIDRILAFAPDQAHEYRDRAVAHLKLEDHRAALEDLTRYLALGADCTDRASVQATVDYLRLRLAPLN